MEHTRSPLAEWKEVNAQEINSIFRAASGIENELIVLQDGVSNSLAARSNCDLPGSIQAFVIQECDCK